MYGNLRFDGLAIHLPVIPASGKKIIFFGQMNYNFQQYGLGSFIAFLGHPQISSAHCDKKP